MTSDTRAQILAIGARLARAEQDADTAALDQIAAADFRQAGPAGFVLDKQQWLGRYIAGSLITSSLAWDDVEVRDFGQPAISTGRHTQRASYQGHPAGAGY
jgi:hypothetical protein